MEKKKSASRFCIQFNEQDPHHQQVMDILNAQGRHKAQFIAAAILHYINCSERPAVLQDVAGLRKVIEMIVLEALESMAEFRQKKSYLPPRKGFKEKHVSLLKSVRTLRNWTKILSAQFKIPLQPSAP